VAAFGALRHSRSLSEFQTWRLGFVGGDVVFVNGVESRAERLLQRDPAKLGEVLAVLLPPSSLDTMRSSRSQMMTSTPSTSTVIARGARARYPSSNPRGCNTTSRYPISVIRPTASESPRKWRGSSRPATLPNTT
jgi:hypothetical protein